MRIHIGIVGDDVGWRTLLNQEGVPHSRVHGDLTPEYFSAVVVNDLADDREIEMLRQYVRLGGGVLCSAKVYGEIRDVTSGHRQVDYLLPEEDSLFASAGLIDIQRRVPVAWSANELPSEKGGDTAYVGSLESGHAVVFPFDASGLIFDEVAQRKSFLSPFDRLPFERVAAVSKNGVRRLVSRALLHLHSVRGLPYVHTWYFPEKAATVFGLRIDTDAGTPSQVEGLYEYLRERRVRASWFVDVGSQQPFLWRYAQMGGHEIGLHGFDHWTWDDPTRNHDNILRARDAFRSLNLGSFGYAAPYGMWNQGLGKVLADFRFEYSSEFAYDYDNLPSYPRVGSGLSKVLQVPVHPISIGSLRRHGYTTEMMKTYFRNVVLEKRSRSEPLMFFHHPGDGNLDVLGALIDECRSAGVQTLTLREYAAWWRERSAAELGFEIKDNLLRVEMKTGSVNCMLRIVRPSGEVAFAEVHPRVDISALTWGPQGEPHPVPPDVERVRRFNYRIPLTVAVDKVSRLRRKR